jgi:peptidoglycan hydrolase CwlO-like protein
MKDNKAVILLVILAVLMAWNIFTTSQIKTDISGYNQKIDSIQTEIDSVYTQNDLIDNQIDLVDTHISNVDKDIQQVTKNITIIKNNTDEKVNNVATIGNIELERLFTERYAN